MNEGKNKHAVALGRLGGKIGGKAKTEAKRKAARENGKRGGRPRQGEAEVCGGRVRRSELLQNVLRSPLRKA